MSLFDIEYIEAILQESGVKQQLVKSHVKKVLVDFLKGFATQKDVQDLRDKDKELEKEIAVLAEKIRSIESSISMIKWVVGFLVTFLAVSTISILVNFIFTKSNFFATLLL